MSLFKSISSTQAEKLIEDSSDLIIIDVRRYSEFKQGKIPNAINIPVEELEWEIEELKESNIYIVDDDFLYDEKRLWTFVNEIKRRDIKKKYICYGRSDFIASHEELMKALKEIGLYYVLVGLESISDKQLKKYDKHSDSTLILHTSFVF